MITIEQLKEEWHRNTDPISILNQLRKSNLLSLAVRAKKNKESEQNLISLLELLDWLAAHPSTPTDLIIELLTRYIEKKRKIMPGDYIANEWSDQVTKKYLQVLATLSRRNDIEEQDIVKLMKHTYQLNDKFDNSLLYDIASQSEENTKAHLKILVDLQKCGKLSSQTIWDILRPPYGKDDNVVGIIAWKYRSPDCMILLLELIRQLESKQIKYLMPDNINKFYSSNIKEALCEHFKMLPLDECIRQCKFALNTNDPLGHIMHLRRSADECNITKGTLKEIASMLGTAIHVREKHFGVMSPADGQPQPTAPSLAALEKGSLPQEPIKRRDRVTTQRLLGRDLRKAVAVNNEDKVKALVNQGADCNYRDDNCDKLTDTSPLFLAILHNNENMVKILLKHGANVNFQRRDGTTPLTAATHYGQENIVALLLQHGADSLAISRSNNSALSLAAAAGHTNMVKALCDTMLQKITREHDRENGKTIKFLKSQFKACLTSKTTRGPVAMILMQFLENIQKAGVPDRVINELLPVKFSFGNKNLEKELVTEIIKLPFGERIETCKGIIENTSPLAQIFWMDHGFFSTARHTGSGHLGVINQLYKNMTGDINHDFWVLMKQDSFSEPYHRDLKNLLDNGANINAYHQNSSTPLCLAAQLAPVETVRFLLKNGADPTLPLKIERSDLASIIQRYAPGIKNNFIHYLTTHQAQLLAILPETIAELYGHDDSARLIKEKRLSMQAAVSSQTASMEASHAAIMQDLIESVASGDKENAPQLIHSKEALLEHIASRPARERYKLYGEMLYNQNHPYYKLFHVKRGLFSFHHSLSDLILFHRVKKYRQQADEVWESAFEGDIKRLNSLLNRGADVNFTKGFLSASPLYAATQNWNTRCVEALLKAGADVNEPTINGATPLFIAAQKGYENILKILLAHHADINVTFKTDQASLRRFAESYSPEKNKRILGKVLDFLRNQPNKDNILMTAIDIANIMEHPEIVALLQQHNKVAAPAAVASEPVTPFAPPPSYQSLYPDLSKLEAGSQSVTTPACAPAARTAIEMEPVVSSKEDAIANSFFGMFTPINKSKYLQQLSEPTVLEQVFDIPADCTAPVMSFTACNQSVFTPVDSFTLPDAPKQHSHEAQEKISKQQTRRMVAE